MLLVGNPGVGYDYLENLEGLTVSDRRVIEVVFAGTRPGGAPLPASIRGAACVRTSVSVGAPGVKAAASSTSSRRRLQADAPVRPRSASSRSSAVAKP